MIGAILRFIKTVRDVLLVRTRRELGSIAGVLAPQLVAQDSVLQQGLLRTLRLHFGGSA
jgi:hypothetical protein